MGDRSNVNVITEEIEDGRVLGVNLYFHWQGRDAIDRVLEHLSTSQARERYGDPAYLTAQIAKVAHPDYDATTGMGVTPFVALREKSYFFQLDNEHSILTVDIPNQSVHIWGRDFRFYDLEEAKAYFNFCEEN